LVDATENEYNMNKLICTSWLKSHLREQIVCIINDITTHDNNNKTS